MANHKQIPIFIATTNKVKIIEISRFIEQNCSHYKTMLLNEKLTVPEVGEGFEEISVYKAKVYSEYFKDKICLTDDSGLAVDYLNGKPGIYSSRFPFDGVTDKERNDFILDMLKDVSLENRTATFYSATAVGLNGKVLANAVGTCKGKVILESVGKNGFGFDPVFIADGHNITFGEMSVDEKLNISHRGSSLRKLFKLLEMEVDRNAK